MSLRAFALCGALALAACSQATPPPAAAAPALAAAPAVYSYADERAAAEAEVAEAKAAIARGPVVWPQWETLGNAELALAQLTGDYAQYTQAGQSLDEAFVLAGRGGPYLSRARYHLAVHRLDRVEADLAHAQAGNNPDLVGIEAARADLAFYRGQYGAAVDGYRAVLERRETVPVLTRLALWHGQKGHLSEALALLDRADAITYGEAPHLRAWLALQRGLLYLERGRWNLAQAHYQRALRLLPGWWLAQEHIAEVHALQGEHEQAIALYTAVIEDTGHPEFIDALAGVLLEQGDREAAQRWIVTARQRYEQRLAALPEASYGHALEHFLEHATPAEALALARRNHTLRPDVEAKIALAEALLGADQAGAALPVLREALRTGNNTAALHAMAARVFAANGLAAKARAEKTRALAINRHAARQYGLPE